MSFLSDICGAHVPFDSEHPIAYITLEMYRDDIRGHGGLGMLASDTLESAKELDLPYIFFTPFYPDVILQEITRGDDMLFHQNMRHVRITPEEKGFTRLSDHCDYSSPLSKNKRYQWYEKKEGSVSLFCITSDDFGELYGGATNSAIRLTQEVVLGFGSIQLLNALHIKPHRYQLNEAATIFTALGLLDHFMDEHMTFEQSLCRVREQTLYTNHTLVQAAEAHIRLEDFQSFVFPHITHTEIQDWLSAMITRLGGQMQLSTLCLELCGKSNGVSLFHAQQASKSYMTAAKAPVHFIGITNGIALTRWVYPPLLSTYRQVGLFDTNWYPAKNINTVASSLPFDRLRRYKKEGKQLLKEYLMTRVDHQGKPIMLPDDFQILSWRRRIAGYKRPDFLLFDERRLLTLLSESSLHILIAGRAHPRDLEMQQLLTRLFSRIDEDTLLSERIHFIQEYDEPLARMISFGTDIVLNVPRVGEEACGTSWEKDVMNNGLLIATPDGGIRDSQVKADREQTPYTPSYLRVSGETEEDEALSMYAHIENALHVLSDDKRWNDTVIRQITEFAPIASPGRMMNEYITAMGPYQ